MRESPAARWARLQAEFHRLADANRHEQSEALAALRRQDALFANELHAMLEADQAGAVVIDRGVEAAARAVLPSPDFVPDVPFGPYRPLKVLGAGGMGIVYLGRRADLDSFAAIKVLREAWLSPDRHARFQLEQRTLTVLQHPGIARLLEADRLPDGTPWFAMEYVDGQPLVDWAMDRRLGIAPRLALFGQVCDAVRHAHDHGVIHRDLKPANVLVRDDGTVKLLDFGIAKQIIRAELDNTATLSRRLTPAYASPEQLVGEPADVQQDVYALGVILFELLSGTRPYDTGEQSPRELVHQLKQREPTRLSDRIAQLRASAVPSANAQETGGVPRDVLTKREWRDLDAIVSTAMHPESGRRYRSVEALQRDLAAFSTRAPIAAREDSPWERVGRFAQRHWQRLAFAAAVLGVVTASLVAYTTRIAAARDVAERERLRAAHVADFLAVVLANDEELGPADSLRVVDVVQRAEQELTQMADSVTRADLLVLLGRVRMQLGDLPRSDSLLQEGERWQRRLHTALTREAVQARLLRATSLAWRGHADSAASLVRAQLQELEQRAPNDTLSRAGTLATLGTVLSEQGRHEEAVEALRNALQLQRAVDSTSKEYDTYVTDLANSYFYLSQYDSSVVWNQRSLRLAQARHGPDHPSVAHNLVNIGILEQRRGRPIVADTLLLRALRIMEGWYGATSPQVAGVLTQYANVLNDLEQYAKAESLLVRSVAIQRRAYGEYSRPHMSAMMSLASAIGERDVDAGIAMTRRAIAIGERALGPDAAHTLVARNNLAATLSSVSRYDEAAAILEDVVARFRRTTPPEDQNRAIAIMRLGRVRWRQQRYREAIPILQEGLSTYRLSAPEPTGFSRAVNAALAQSYAALGHRSRAAVHARDSLP